jgi:hypothetical protein
MSIENEKGYNESYHGTKARTRYYKIRQFLSRPYSQRVLPSVQVICLDPHGALCTIRYAVNLSASGKRTNSKDRSFCTSYFDPSKHFCLERSK